MKAKYNAGDECRKPEDRPEKPHPEFPLFAHPLGYWSKKIKGQTYNFGRWGRKRNGVMVLEPYEAGWQEAREKYNQRLPDILAGKVKKGVVPDAPPVPVDDRLTVKDLANRFLTAKTRKMEAGELTQRSFQELFSTAKRLIEAFGDRFVEDLSGADFEKLRASISAKCGSVRLGNEIVRTRSIFKYAVDNHLVPGQIRYGSEFKKPDKAILRKLKADSPKKLFSQADIKALLDAANTSMKAMILLGLNCGAGNTDVTNLSFKHLDLKSGWLEYPRGKTGIGRRCPLWPETVAKLREVIAQRPTPKDADADGEVVFLTPFGNRFVRVSAKSRTDEVTVLFKRLLTKVGIIGRKGVGFYSLRHTFATIGLQTGDRDAVKSLMGHAFGDVLALYDEAGPSDARLKAVTQHVRAWALAPRASAD